MKTGSVCLQMRARRGRSFLLATAMRTMSIRMKMMQRLDMRGGAFTHGQVMRWVESLVFVIVVVVVWLQHIFLFFSFNFYYLEDEENDEGG